MLQKRVFKTLIRKLHDRKLPGVIRKSFEKFPKFGYESPRKADYNLNINKKDQKINVKQQFTKDGFKSDGRGPRKTS